VKDKRRCQCTIFKCYCLDLCRGCCPSLFFMARILHQCCCQRHCRNVFSVDLIASCLLR